MWCGAKVCASEVVGGRSETVGKRSEAIGGHSEAVGECPETIGGRSEALGECPEAVGGHWDGRGEGRKAGASPAMPNYSLRLTLIPTPTAFYMDNNKLNAQLLRDTATANGLLADQAL